jgi:ATP-dependent Zn protease
MGRKASSSRTMTAKPRRAVSAVTATAYHEAGHAVACYFIGVKVRSATIVADKDQGFLGYVRHENMFRGLRPDIELSDRARLQIERRIIMSLAGFSAQRRFNKKSWRSYHGRSDFRFAVDLASHIVFDGAGMTAFLNWLQYRSDALIKLRWPEVARVARALLESKTMTGAEIVEVIEGEHFTGQSN